ncbi:Transcription antitermination factor NusG [Chitinophaga costaii]|uniref:Transcription antitermination factor NusG n=1 Tax=Chitinophaga costaii TaxID=1335309 RepID=A0A1C3YUN1_9BACT|nr:UpxY family transcription antiterminator [Chitinophaga costaii]PUZ30112.1 antitermination protein NusG [Chitinophaga costaii]SCB73773.1 Transcription antitermination factor NusG [Chitinophaga costaii]
MQTFREGWYLLYTRPRHEKKVNTRLLNMQIDSFLPMMKSIRKWGDRKKSIDEPLFPSYIFIFLRHVRDYFSVIDMEGSLYFVRNGKSLAEVHEDIIKDIKMALAYNVGLEVSMQRFPPGQKLCIGSGPLTGMSCEVVQYANTRKILVRVHILQGNVLLSIPSQDLMLPVCQ